MSSDRLMTTRRIQICLCLLELSLAMTISVLAFFLLKILPFRSSWPSRIYSTLAGILIIKSTLSSLLSLKNRSAYEEIYQSEDIQCEDEVDGLKLFASMQERRAQSQLGSGEDGVSCVSSSFEDAVKSLQSNNQTISREISYTKKFLMDIEEEERNNPPSKISFPLFVVLATVLLQVAVRILVIVQNLRRSLPWRRRRSTRNGLIQFSDIPFTIGRSMSSSGCSFRIFSFLNRWLESNVDDKLQHDFSPDNSPLLLQAVSIDRISINSSHLVMKQPGQHSTAMSQLSWFGIRLEGIDISVTMLLKRKSRRVGEREVSTSNDLHSVSLQLQVGALEVGIFPCFIDWCRGSEIKLNARAFFDARASDIPAYGKHSILSGFGLSATLSHLFICRALKGARAKSRDAVVSWDKMQSFLHLNLHTVFDSGSYGRHSQRLTASSMTLPSGFCLVHNSREGSTWIKPSPLSRRVHMNLGSQFTLGINLEHVQKILSLLKDTPSPLIKNFSANDQHATHGNSKKKSSIQFVELNAVIRLQLFIFISRPRDKTDTVTLDFLSLESPNLALLWRNNDESLPDSTGDQIQRDAKQRCDVPYPLLVASTKYISLQHDVFYGDQLDCSFAVRDLVRLNQIQVKVGVTHDQCQRRDRSKRAIIDLGGIFIRADREDVNKLAYTMKALVDTKPLLADLQSRAKETKQTLSSNAKHSMSQYFNAVSEKEKTTRDTLSYIQFSCDSVDVIVELSASPEIVTTDDKVRVALLQTETNVTILRNRENPNEESGDLDQPNLDLNLPDQLFDFGVKRCAHHHLIDASVLRAEGSVTFLPHLSLPVILEPSQSVDERPHGCSQEVSFHGEFSTVALKSTVPLNSRSNDERSVFVCFDALNIYERFGKKLEVGTSLFSFPVHKFSFRSDFSKPQETDWSMAQTYTLYAAADFVKILHCKGSFCMTEERNIETDERRESISVQFSRGSAEFEVIWSPILQWLAVSCNSRIQRALACLRTPGSKKDLSNRTFSSHKTNIRIGVDCNATANVHAYVGVESYLCAVIEGGSTMNISIAKYPSSSSATLKEETKPNLSFEAKQITLHFNDIETPICVVEGISLQNYHRRAYYNEINEYCNTNTSPIDYCGDELVSDHDGHPLKEIFELRVGSSITVQFPPALHFGQVIEDMTLVPKALFDGLNRLKGDHKKQRKKYQLMSMKCTVPFLDISLMDYDPGSERSTGTNILRDELRIFFEAVEVSIERNEPPSRTQARINSLDEDDSSTHLYGPQIQGGFICLTVKHVVCILYPLNLVTPLLRMDEFALNGYLHLAALSPTTPGLQEGKTVTSLLLCHHNHSTGNHLSSHQHRQCSCHYGVSLHSTGLPVKIYIDGQVKSGGLNLMFGSVLSDSISRLMECIQRLLPPPPQSDPDHEVAMKLTWWDSVRFFIHGSISISADELSFRWLLDSYVFWDHSIMFYCQKCEMRHTVGLFKVDASDINVSIPGTAYDMSVHPSVRDTKSSFHLPHQAESVVSRERHPLLYVPLLKAQVNISWEMLHPGGVCHEHHSVCMKIKGDEEVRRRDKFAAFRTDGVNVQFWIELPGSDSIGADNWVALRVDVLPWFTHVNSTSTSSPQTNEKDSKPFPTFRSVVVKASVKNMKMATWFEDEEDMDGLCLTVKAVNYSASLDGGKEIVIEGPAKAALLDVSEFKHVVNIVGDHQEENDDLIDNELIASEFGAVRSLCNFEVKQVSPQKESFHREDVNSSLFMKLPFLKLQELSSHIHELEYIVSINKIDICNQSMTKILAVPSQVRRTTLDGRGQSSTWSILVARCRLLWTIEIRDSIMGISKDLIYTFGFMNSQLRQLQVVSKETSEQEHNTGESCGVASPFVGEGLSRRDSFNKSRLAYLLAEDGGAPRRRSALHAGQIQAASFDEQKMTGRNSTIPTLDIHFSNPQVQLHSIATGGSIILAIERAQVEAREFIHFIVPNARSKDGKVSPSNLLKKTGKRRCENWWSIHEALQLTHLIDSFIEKENTYTLTNMEAYSLSTRVDVNLGLPWLEVCSPKDHRHTHSAAVDERDHSNLCHQNIYPPHLHQHEPLSFSKSGLLHPILNKFTFQSTQIFHRPPHHNSTQELIHFINQGLVVGQDEAAVDNIELLIDLLNFNLDSYQFKTTLDVLRNVLLEVPKPHQRHQSLDQDDTSTKSPGGISSVAATEMEQLLSGDIKYRDKKGRQMLRTAAMSLLREIEDKIALEGSEVFRRISYTLGKLQWNMQNQDVIDDVQISFTGFNGQHDYSRDGSTISQFSLEDVRISSLKPGPDSIGFLDPTSVVKSVLGNARSACDRCGQYFDHSNNDLFSCAFHLGQYDYGIWTCCKATNFNASGCKSGPHSGKERAAVIRVESLPQVVGGLSLYSHFEVNLFPGIPHTLMIQISKSMSRLLKSYFFVEDDHDEEFDAVSTFSDSTGSDEAISMQSEYLPKSTIRRKSPSIGAQGAPPSGNRCIPGSSTELDSKSSELKSPSKAAEVVLFKVWRVGYVDVNVSVGGFKRLPQASSIDICVPAYSKAYEIGTWEFHGKKYLTHVVREVLKSGASSGLDKFRRKVMGGSSNTSTGQSGDQLEPILESSSPNLSPRHPPPILDSSASELGSFIGKHLFRPMGAADILGTPAKKRKKKLFGL